MKNHNTLNMIQPKRDKRLQKLFLNGIEKNDTTGYWEVLDGVDVSGKDQYGVLCTKNNCVEFDGVNDYIDLGEDITALNTEGYEFLIRFYPKDYSATLCASRGGSSYFMYMQSDYSLKFSFGVGNSYVSSVLAVADTWNVVKVVGNGTSMDIYNLTAGTSDLGITDVAGFRIGFLGRLGEVGTVNFEGLMDYAQFQTPNKTYRWDLCEGAGITVYDTVPAEVGYPVINGEIKNATLSTFWTTDDKATPSNLLNGFSGYGSFDGVNDYIDFGDNVDITETTSITFETRFQYDSSQDYPTMASKYSGGGADGYYFRLEPSGKVKIRLYSTDGGDDDVDGNIALSEGEWYTVKAVIGAYDDDIEIWVNGVKDVSQKRTAKNCSNSQILSVGNISGVASLLFKGKMNYLQAETATNLYRWDFNKLTSTTLPATTGDVDGTNNGVSYLYTPAQTGDTGLDVFDETLTNPAGKYHNNAETNIRQKDVQALKDADDNNFWFEVGGTPKDISYADIVDTVGDYIFARTFDNKTMIITYSEILTGVAKDQMYNVIKKT